MIGRRILSLSMEKLMLTLIKTKEGESSDPVRTNVVKDTPRDLFQTDACTNISCNSPEVALLASMVILGKSSHNFL